MPRFIYNASAMALGGSITRPANHHLEPIAATVLPSSGGTASAKAGPFSLTLSGVFILSFDSAETMVQGDEAAPGNHNTVITSVIRKLNVLDTLKADEVICKLTLSYDTNSDKVSIDTAGSGFTNLTLAGEPFEVTLDTALGREAADYKKFRKAHPEHPETRGAVHSSLGRNPKLKFEPYDEGYYHQPNFGRIYFAEWTAAPYRQNLTMLRLKLGSPAAAALDLGSGGGNGSPLP